RYVFAGGEILDKYSPLPDQRGWQRNLQWRGEGKILAFVAGGGPIQAIGDGHYGINDMQLFLHVSTGKPVIQNSREGGHDMYVPLSSGETISYSLIW
ncbi:MAG: hypothetical protein AAF206_29955, partial [Bacteroidota bacterium]